VVARIFVSKEFPEYFFDEKALSLEKYIPDGEL
jgi:Fe-S cluster biosynthesis and repair protein YggX